VPDFPVRDVFAPLGWIFVLLLAADLLLFVVLVALREHWLFYERRRAPIRERLEPVVARLVDGRDPEGTAAELERIVAGLDRTSRPVAAWLLRDLTRDDDEAARRRIREILDRTGAIDAAEEGTRRRMPWRRALACEILGVIGAERSVPVLLDRLDDDRAEVRMTAARALGAIGSAQAEPKLASAFLERTKVPTGVAYDALRGLGPAGAEAFWRGLERTDPTVRVTSCFGIAAAAGEVGVDGAVATLTRVMEGDDSVRVRTAATRALGMVGGTAPPPALLRAARDPELRVRREAVAALSSFDDPESVQMLADSVGDADREIALRSATALLALADRPRSGVPARAAFDGSRAWSVDYVRTIEELAA
jgi:HEAT repeat protein